MSNEKSSQKSSIRLEMEQNGEAIYQSWLKDCSKVREMQSIIKMLTSILGQDSLLTFFQNNKDDLCFFLTTFSTQVTSNILRAGTIYGDNGEEIALNILCLYLQIFIKYLNDPIIIPLYTIIKEIFDYKKGYYQHTSKNPTSKKLLSSDNYNIDYLKRSSQEQLHIEKGKEIDVLQEYKEKYNTKMKTWLRGIVCDTFNDHFTVRIFAGDASPITFKYNTFECMECGVMTKDWNWRKNLQIGDMIDCYERKRFYPGMIVEKNVTSSNDGLIRIVYRVRFRVYEAIVADLEPYRRFWPTRQVEKDNNGRRYLGDPPNFDEYIEMYSRYIFPPNTKIFTEGITQLEYYEEKYELDSLIQPYDYQDKKVYAIGRQNHYSCLYNLLLSYFGRQGGFDAMLFSLTLESKNSTSNSNNNNQQNELFFTICHILKICRYALYKPIIIEIATKLQLGIFNYLSSITNADLRNIKKEHIEIIGDILSFYLGVLLGEEKRDAIIEEFNISFAMKMIKTSYLDKRTNAIKTIIDLIKNNNEIGNKDKEKRLLDIIEQNHIFYEIYGPNSHVQLITKSKELLEIMLQHDKLSNEEIEMIWMATRKGDLESKLTILKILRELSLSAILQPKHVIRLLDNIFMMNSPDLIDEEIDLIYELTLNQNDENMTERCIEFFTTFLLGSNSDEGKRIDLLVNKIYIITKRDPVFKVNVIKMAMASLEENKNSAIGMKILSAYIIGAGSSIENDYDMERLLIEDNRLVNLYIKSFKEYMIYVKGRMKGDADIDTLTLNDKFNHSQNIKARLSFINELVNSNLWRIKDDPIDFVFGLLVKEGICSKDEQLFYHWIKMVIDKCSFETEVKLFELFTERIGSVNKGSSAMNISIEAFDTFIKIFNDINIKNQKIIQKKDKDDPNKTYDILMVKPKELEGFDILWTIIFESYSDEIMNKGIEALHSIFSNNTHNNTTALSNTVDQSQDLIRLCLHEMQSNPSPNKSHKSLLMIKRIIEESEKYGTAGVISHNSLLKHNMINIKVNSHLRSFYYVKIKSFTLNLYSNTTIFDLKTIISKHVKCHHDFIQFLLCFNSTSSSTTIKYELKPNDNGKTLHMLNIPIQTLEIILNENNLDQTIPQHDIIINHHFTDKALKVFNYWFDQFSTNNKMSQEDCARFIGAVTNSHEDVPISDSRVRELFNERDHNKDNIIEREEFIQFYLDASNQKVALVIENLKTMGIRNDLMNMFDPYYIKPEEEMKKESMPRYQLAINEEFFNTIFNMQIGNDELSKEVFEFIGMLSTNPVIYNNIIAIGNEANSNDEGKGIEYLNGDNVVKLIYSLQIIESLIEGINSQDGEIDRKSNEDDKDKINKCRKWLLAFIKTKGYEQCVILFRTKVTQIIKQENNYFDILCLQYLLQIIKAFYIASIDDNITTTHINENNNMTILHDYLQKEQLCSIIQKVVNDDKLIQCLMSALDIFIKIEPGSLIEDNNLNLLNPIIELITILIPSSITKSSQINNSYWIPILTYGLLNNNEYTRMTFIQSAIRMCSILQTKNEYEFIEALFNNCYNLIKQLSNNNLSQTTNTEQENHHIENPEVVDKSSISLQLFTLFTYLLEIFTSNKEQFTTTTTTSFNINKFINEIIEIINNKINNNNQLSEDLFIGYLSIITSLCNSNKDIKEYISEQSTLMQEILTKILFKQGGDANDNPQMITIIQKDMDTNSLVDIDLLNKFNSNQNGSERIRISCYNFILSIVKGSISNFERFFNIDIISKDDSNEIDVKDNKKSSLSLFSLRQQHQQSNKYKSENHVGLKNPGCICYMNSTLQQFYMVPSLRYTLLRCNDNIKENNDPSNGIDDNMLHQVQKMFAFLEMSHRVDYNPFPFTYSFKDWDGLPTKLIEQKDAQEFLGIFLDRLESECKLTEFKYMLQSIFGGKNCSQVICSQCGKVSNRYEDLVFLSLEVKNMKTLNDSLDKMISEETIDGYKCDGCNQNVSITKRNLLSSLPNVLIIHLQRICYNFEYDHNEKINSRLEFPRQINLKPYTIEEIMRKSNSNNNEGNGIEGDNEQDDVYFKSDAYYDYYLMGVIVHVGSADSGHYYSYINTFRGGSGCEAEYDPKDNSMSSSWLEFNDSDISKFDVGKLEDNCFGGVNEDSNNNHNQRFSCNKREKCRNAYMLIYERKIKSPMKIIVNPSTISNINPNMIISYKQEDEKKISKQYDLCRYYNTPEFKEKQLDLMSKVFNDVERNEYFQFLPFYYTDRKMAIKYYMEIYEDNSQLETLQNITDLQFTMFFEKIIEILEETVLNNISTVKNDTAVKISMTFLNFIFTILSKKDKSDLLLSSIQKFIKIVSHQRICLDSTWYYIRKHYNILKGRLFNDNKQTVVAYSKLINELLILIIKGNDKDKEEFINSLSHYDINGESIGNAKEGNKSDMALWVFMQIIWLFPKIPTKSLENMQPMFTMIQSVLNSSDELMIYMANNEFLFIFITFLLGRESPCYEQTFNNRNDYWDHAMRSHLIEGGEIIVDIIYDILSYTTFSTTEGLAQLSSRDLECLTCPSYLKYIFKNCDWNLGKYLTLLSSDNFEYTLLACNELLQTVNSFEYINEPKTYITLLRNIMPIFTLKDGYQQIRMEFLMGIPQYIIEGGIPFPLIGYHTMIDVNSRYITNKTFMKNTYKHNLIQKLFDLKGNNDNVIEALLVICENCIINKELYRYLLCVPYENMTEATLFNWGMTIVNTIKLYNSSNSNENMNKLSNLLIQLKQMNHNDCITNDHAIIPLFNGFHSNEYLIKDIKKVEIQLVHIQNNVTFLLCDYYANTIPINQPTNNTNPYAESTESFSLSSIEPIDFSYSKKNFNLMLNLSKEIKEEENIDYNNNNEKNTNEILFLQAENIKFLYEKEMFMNISEKLTNYKKIIIESKYSVPNAKNILRRFIALNKSNQFPLIVMKLKRLSTTIENVNEFIPESPIGLTFNFNSVLDVFSMTKFNCDKEWTWDLDEGSIEIMVQYEQNKYGSVCYTQFTEYTPIPNEEDIQ